MDTRLYVMTHKRIAEIPDPLYIYPFHIRCNSNPGPETGANPVRELHL